ncbi:MAG: cation:proton antiporter [Ilumatobacteraceae bacterium]
MTVWTAEDAGLDVLLGAFAAGMALRLFAACAGEREAELVEAKIEGIGFGFLIPIFFVVSGMRFDLDVIVDRPVLLLAILVFLLAILVIRGGPVFRRGAPLAAVGAHRADLLRRHRAAARRHHRRRGGDRAAEVRHRSSARRRRHGVRAGAGAGADRFRPEAREQPAAEAAASR